MGSGLSGDGDIPVSSSRASQGVLQTAGSGEAAALAAFPTRSKEEAEQDAAPVKHHLEVTQQQQNRNPRGGAEPQNLSPGRGQALPCRARAGAALLGGLGGGINPPPPKSFTHLMLKSSISVMPSKQVAMERAKRAMPTKMCWGL